jgi:hypothetical protein
MLKPASLADIKAELQNLPPHELLSICLRLARFKQDNKELLSFLLFQSADTDDFIAQVQQAISEGFAQVNTSTVFFAKKSIRKILRQVNKVVRYAGQKELEVALHLHFLKELWQLPAAITQSALVDKLARTQHQKISKLIRALHEDLQYDFRQQLAALES